MKTLHRICSPIIALLSIPAALFLPFFRIMVAQGTSSDDVKTNLLDSLGLGEYISLSDLISFIKGGGSSGTSLVANIIEALTENGSIKLSEVIDVRWGTVFIVFFALCIIAAVAVAVVGIIGKHPGATAWISLGGGVCAVCMNASFNAFAKPILAGSLNLNSLLSSVMGDSLGEAGSLLSLLFGSAYSVDYMRLSVAYTAILLIFITLTVFGIAASLDEKKR